MNYSLAAVSHTRVNQMDIVSWTVLRGGGNMGTVRRAGHTLMCSQAACRTYRSHLADLDLSWSGRGGSKVLPSGWRHRWRPLLIPLCIMPSVFLWFSSLGLSRVWQHLCSYPRQTLVLMCLVDGTRSTTSVLKAPSHHNVLVSVCQCLRKRW